MAKSLGCIKRFTVGRDGAWESVIQITMGEDMRKPPKRQINSDRQIDTQTDRQIDRQIDKQIDRQID